MPCLRHTGAPSMARLPSSFGPRSRQAPEASDTRVADMLMNVVFLPVHSLTHAVDCRRNRLMMAHAASLALRPWTSWGRSELGPGL